MTLTLKSCEIPLTVQISRLYTSFAKLRQRKRIAQCVHAGIAFLELTRNEKTGLWHPHLHVLFEGQYLPQQLLKTEWLTVTGDSYIVDVRRIRSVGEAASYVAKYSAKGVSASVWRDQEALKEAITALAGRRTFNCFGHWLHLGLSRRTDSDIYWEALMPLSKLLRRAADGDQECRQILATLKGVPVHEPLDRELRNAESG